MGTFALVATAANSLRAEATVIPDNGMNTFTLPFVDGGIPAEIITEDDLKVEVKARGPGIHSAVFVDGSLSVDKEQLTIDICQTLASQAFVAVTLKHTLVR